MAGAGDIVANLSVTTTDWADGFDSANSILDEFSNHLGSSISTVERAGAQIGAMARFSATSIAAMGVGLGAVGGHGAGLLKVAGTLAGIGGVASGLSNAFKGLKSGTTYTQKLVGAIGAVGAAAGIAVFALKGISAVMTRYDKDTKKVDALAVTLKKVALAATVATIGIKTIGATVRTVGAVGSLAVGTVTGSFQLLGRTIATIPAGINLVTGSMRRMGAAGIGAARSAGGAIGSFAAHAGDALGEVGHSVASVAVGFAAGGLIGGIATLAGVLAAGGASLKSMGIEGTTAEGPLRALYDSTSKLLTPLQKIGGGIAQAGISAIGQLATKAQPYVNALAQAVSVLADRFISEYLPAITTAAQSGLDAFSKFFGYLETAWGPWISDSVAALVEVVENIDIYFQIAQQSIVMFASNSILQVGDFFANIGVWLEWFGDNWSDALFTAADLAATVFINIGQNLRNIFSQVWEWVQSGFTTDLEIDWTPLTDGFRSTVKKWPKLVETELDKSTPELDKLYKKLGARQAAAKTRKSPTDIITQAAAETDEKTDTHKAATKGTNAAALIGSKEAATILLAGVGGQTGPNKQEVLIAQQTTMMKQMRDKLDKGLTLEFEEVTLA